MESACRELVFWLHPLILVGCKLERKLSTIGLRPQPKVAVTLRRDEHLSIDNHQQN